MSVSLPSPQIVVADVPEVRDFSASNFVYNFFTADESVNSTGTVPEQYLQRPSEYYTSPNNVKTAESRVPRYIEISFKPAVISTDPSGYKWQPQTDLIRANLDKIVAEEHFTNSGYTGVNFEPVGFEKKVFLYVSGSISTADNAVPDTLNGSSLTAAASSMSTEDVPTGYLMNSLVQPYREGRAIHAADDDPHANLSIRMQFDTKFVAIALASSLFDPLSTYNEDILTLYRALQPVQSDAIAGSKYTYLHHNEYDPQIRYLSIESGDESRLTQQSSTRVVGYIISKYEVMPDGSFGVLEPIIIENPKASRFVDFEIKYGTQYAYSIKTVALCKYVTLLQSEDGEVETALVTFLVSSRPSPKQYVKTVEFQPPPPPVDVGFNWDYEKETLSVMWSFPVNPQRDIKKFQIFRRNDISKPFELLALYDFDDSQVKYPDPENENVGPERKIIMRSPLTNYLDEDFTRDSKFIYAIAAVDAHGLTSGYSQQFEVSFDRFRNRIVKKLIASSGSPKPYPNYTLELDVFVDSISENRSTLELTLAPDCYSYVTSNGMTKPLIDGSIAGGRYQLQLINTDNQKLSIVNINIDDRRTTAANSSAGIRSIADLMPYIRAGKV